MDPISASLYLFFQGLALNWLTGKWENSLFHFFPSVSLKHTMHISKMRLALKNGVGQNQWGFLKITPYYPCLDRPSEASHYP